MTNMKEVIAEVTETLLFKKKVRKLTVKEIVEECLKEKDPESGLLHFFSFAINVQPYVKAGVHTNYGDEIEKLLDAFVYSFFERATERTEVYKHYNKEEREFVIKYHCLAIKGILDKWTEKDTQNLNFIIHQIYLILLGKITP